MKHQDVINTIDNFIERRFYQYAIMINGDWGCGKTYFIKNDLIPHIRNKEYDDNGTKKKKDLNYISLYGIKDTSDISDILYSQAIEDKIEKIGNGEKARKLLKRQKPIDKTTKPFQFMSLATNILAKVIIRKTELGDERDLKHLIELFPDFDNNVIIFDDLERCSCDINDVLGFINNFVEHSKAKVIVVANEKEIGSAYSDKKHELQMLIALNEHLTVNAETAEEKDNRVLRGDRYKPDESHFSPEKLELRRSILFGESEKYKRIKEKVIGETITYEPELKTIFQQLIQSNIANAQLKEALEYELDKLVEFAIRDNHKNIRTFLFFLEKINTIFRIIDNKYLRLHSKIVEYCYRSSISWMSGKKNQPKWDNEEYGNQNFGESEFSNDRLFGYRFIDSFIREGHIDKESVNNILKQHEKKVKEECLLKNDPYLLIKEWYNSEDEKVKQWINSIIENVENDVYSTALYPDLIHNLAYIQAYGLFVDLIESAFQKITAHLEKMDHDQIVPVSYERFFMVEKDEADIFDKHMQVIKRIIEEKNNASQQKEYQRILNDTNSDWTNEILAITKEGNSVKGWSFIYWISPDIIIERLKICNNKELYNFRRLLQNIYGKSVFYEHRADDYDHLCELKKQIKNVDVSPFGEIKKQKFKWIERDLETYLRKFPQYERDTSIEITEE